MRTLLACLCLLACAAPPPSPDALVRPRALRCEYLDTPLGVDARRPRFSWVVGDRARGAVQSAYQILVATAPERLAAGAPDVWDSGKVPGDRQVHVEWQGPPIASATRYHWTVRTWDGAGRPSQFAEPVWFETGLLTGDDWGGTWIGDGSRAPSRTEDFYGPLPAPLFRKAFHVAGPCRSARLYITGLGYHEAWLNGARVGDHRLDPGWTQYGKLVPYVVHDVTAQVLAGENVLGVVVGNGWYNPLPLRLWGKLDLRQTLTIGQPKLRCRLDVVQADGSMTTIVSDASWRTAPGPILRNNVYLGEHYDARRELPGWDRPGFDDAAWAAATAAPAPRGELRWLPVPPVRATRELAPVRIATPRPGTHVVDFGQNFAGVVRLRLTAPAGTEIVLRYAEELRADGTIDVNSTVAAQVKSAGVGGPGAPAVAAQEDRYVCRGGGVEVFEPRFTFHGFRHAEIAGLPAAPAPGDVVGLRWSADLADASSFACSDPLCNRIQEVVEWTLLSNTFGVLSDCPARERFGYGGDMVASADAYLANFDMAAFHAKAVGDFARDARPGGGLPECAPDVGVNESGLSADTGPLGWMLAHPLLLHRSLVTYGNRRLAEEQYETLVRLVRFGRGKLAEHVAIACFGDHGGIGVNPVPVMATVAWYRIVAILAGVADALGRADDAREFGELALAIRAAFAKWIDAGTGEVFLRTQAGQAAALACDLVPAPLREKATGVLLDLVREQGGRLTTGMFGTQFLLDALTDAGRADVAFALVTTREYPGYGYMIDQGATTLWEHWSRQEHWSRNHPIYAAVSAWFQRSLLGIRQADGSMGWQRIVVKPEVVGGLTWARGHYDSVRGRIASAWRRDGDALSLDVEIPANARAVVFVPMLGRGGAEVREGDTVIVRAGVATGGDPAIDVRRVGATACEVLVGSGTYRFQVR